MTTITPAPRFRPRFEPVYAGSPGEQLAGASSMALNTLFFSGPNRVALLVAFALPLACFKGGDDEGPVAEDDTSTETSDTDNTCEVATDGCPCTTGGGCNPGLECVEDTCGPIQAVCGNGMIEAGESCDDANDDNTDSCTTLCTAPSCTDGIVSGEEIDVDCGDAACGVGCDFGQACLTADDCEFPSCGLGPDGVTSVCELPTSCAHWLTHNPGATDNVYLIDPDGMAGELPEMEVFCHMTKDGGGWTLVFVASDDDVDTWTWNNRDKMSSDAEPVGSLNSRNLDFMSPAYFSLPFSDLLFIHQPSNVWAHYAGVGNGTTQTIADVIAGFEEPVCDFNLEGIPLAGGTLTQAGGLCDTHLYFNLGDHEVSLEECMNLDSASNSATYGPVWSADNGDGCPFDDPAEYGLGPQAPCGFCPTSFPSTEFDYLGYASPLNLNTGTKKTGQNYLQMYVR